MEERQTRYPGYKVLGEAKEWDPHTREIVLHRLGPFPQPQFLDNHEVEMVKAIAGHLSYDQREEILVYIVNHLDQQLQSPIGESQRLPDCPPAKQLVRWGLAALDKLAQLQFQQSFLQISTAEQISILASLQKGQCRAIPDWERVPQKELFNKLAGDIISAYYSHPSIWSEIGYGGPAYPRGYVRVELGLTDPWEAQRNG